MFENWPYSHESTLPLIFITGGSFTTGSKAPSDLSSYSLTNTEKERLSSLMIIFLKNISQVLEKAFLGFKASKRILIRFTYISKWQRMNLQ